jgi:hypothetical protein
MGLKKRNTSSNMPRLMKKAIKQVCDSRANLKFSRGILNIKKAYSGESVATWY